MPNSRIATQIQVDWPVDALAKGEIERGRDINKLLREDDVLAVQVGAVVPRSDNDFDFDVMKNLYSLLEPDEQISHVKMNQEGNACYLASTSLEIKVLFLEEHVLLHVLYKKAPPFNAYAVLSVVMAALKSYEASIETTPLRKI